MPLADTLATFAPGSQLAGERGLLQILKQLQGLKYQLTPGNRKCLLKE